LAATRADADTIAAIATGHGGGIGIVRISGPRAEALLATVVIGWPTKRPPSHLLHHGYVRHPSTGERLDEVLACVMRAPRSYTGEDVGEIQGHGGRLVLARVLDAVLAAGARPAEPGEFTRRAFESGRIDLTRAEAVAALIGARSERALRAAQSLQAGALAREIDGLRTQVVHALAELEGAIDFPDEQLDAAPERVTGERLGQAGARLRGLAASYRPGDHQLVEVALLGRVNAGKSSLFNALVGEERALVDAAAGTTRDVVEAEVELAGARLRLLDSAGERFDGDAAVGTVERRGLDLGRRRRGRAEVAVLVVDATLGFGAGERALWDELDGTARLIAWNKRDLGGAPAGTPPDARVIETAAPTGAGVPELGRAVAAALDQGEGEPTVAVVSRRQREALLDGALALDKAAAALAAGEPSELAAVDARAALHHLGRVTGETVDADVLDAIFSRFCIGK
jgi:tRNA modification GTPase